MFYLRGVFKLVKKEKKKSKNKKLQEKMFMKKESSWLSFKDAEQKKIFKFADSYKKFMRDSKTERLCIKSTITILKKNGFKDMSKLKTLKTGDKVYKNIKDKTVIAAIIGKNKEEYRLIGSHVDSPRLDLKPHPLYQDSELTLLQSHYYGGIKKYHWVNVPLALHGVAFTKKGKKVEVHIGDKENDPKFIIPDLLPHLAQDQMKREARKTVEGEELNIIFGHMPINDKDIDQKVKFNVMKHLHDEYGLVEEDFACAELEFVPAQNPIDIGLDRGLVGAYGQDDKACVFSSLMALINTKAPKNTALGLFVDKEEIGSYGNTGANSFMLLNFTREYRNLLKLDSEPTKILEHSKSISADGTAAQDPTFSSVNDPHNVSFLGRGVSIEKYGGGGGKYSTNDAHAEYMQEIRGILDEKKIPWQTGELGKVDIGGGGTIAMLLSRYGMDCLDAGPCILGMHSPCEVISKADLYASYLLYKEFFKN